MLCVVGAMNAGALAMMLSLRQEAISHATEDSRNLVGILAGQADRLFEAVDVVERNIIEKFDTHDVHSPESVRVTAKRRFMHEILASGSRSLQFVTWLSVLDDAGQLVSTSRVFPAPAFDLRERDYVKALSSPDGPKIFVSQPIANLDNGRLTIFVGRRIESAGGQFLGIIIGGIEAAYFHDIFDSIDLDPTTELVLERDDGIVLSSRTVHVADAAQRPDVEAPSAPRPRAGPPATTIDAVAQLENYPLRIKARKTVDAVLADWGHQCIFVAIMLAAVDLSVLMAGLLGLRHLRQTKRLGELQHHAARHDMLTGLPNRAYFHERLADALLESEVFDFGLLLLDLDRFKEVNDSQGHQAGDELLKLVTARLISCLGPNDFLARLGGDEFAIIVHGVRTSSTLSRFGAKALKQFDAPFLVRERSFAVGASIGVALGSANEDPKRLFDQADMALYQAKESGRGAIRFFSAELSAARRERNALAHDVAEAVQAQAFELHFQPIVDLETCELAGFEALLRWNHPVRGMVPPSTFIPIAEETGAIGPLGTWVLREACRQAASWPSHLTVAVNLSAAQLKFGDIAAEAGHALRASGLSASRLEIEITESVLLDQPSAQTTLRRLVGQGISISLDDFGTGYSSLSYLRSFPFGRIKIDRTFVAEMMENREAAAIVQTVKDLAGRLGMAVTAEGIETHEQLRLLQTIGCNAGQGFLISRAMPADDVAAFVDGFQARAPAPAPVARRAAGA